MLREIDERFNITAPLTDRIEDSWTTPLFRLDHGEMVGGIIQGEAVEPADKEERNMSTSGTNEWLNRDNKSMEHPLGRKPYPLEDWQGVFSYTRITGPHESWRYPKTEGRGITRKLTLQHVPNPLHFYCRLVDLKTPRTVALKIVLCYECLWNLFSGPRWQ